MSAPPPPPPAEAAGGGGEGEELTVKQQKENEAQREAEDAQEQKYLREMEEDGSERYFKEKLEQDSALAHFKMEFIKLLDHVKKTSGNVDRLGGKRSELRQEIAENADKVQLAVEMQAEDQELISELKGEIEKAWTMITQSNEEEARSKKEVLELKREIARLTVELEGSSRENKSRGEIERGLAAEKQALVDEKNALQKRLDDGSEENKRNMLEVTDAEATKAESALEIQSLRELVASKKTELDRSAGQIGWRARCRSWTRRCASRATRCW